jgi:hypothetical protein
MRCSIENFRQITLVTPSPFDADQNISDFKGNNCAISVVYLAMAFDCRAKIYANPLNSGEKKGCAARTPNPNREPSGTDLSPCHKTHVHYG